jgi:hypothetical protein
MRLHGTSAALHGFMVASGLNRLKLPMSALIKSLLAKDSNGPAKPRDP